MEATVPTTEVVCWWWPVPGPGWSGEGPRLSAFHFRAKVKTRGTVVAVVEKGVHHGAREDVEEDEEADGAGGVEEMGLLT